MKPTEILEREMKIAVESLRHHQQRLVDIEAARTETVNWITSLEDEIAQLVIAITKLGM